MQLLAAKDRTMNPILQRAFEKTVTLFKVHPMVVAAYHSGSIGTEREDAYSDVDPVFVVKRESFLDFDKALPQLFAEAVATPILWWPERWIWQPGTDTNIDIHRNYAIFFEFEGKLLQYDMNFVAVPQEGHITVNAQQFIFDKAGVLDVAQSPAPARAAPGEPDARRLVWTIQMYWIYVYIHAKHIKRRDLFKLLYAQQELFHEHLVILQYLDATYAQGWWPLLAHQVDAEKQAHLLPYFSKADVDVITDKLPEQIRVFSEDARAACEKWEVTYPAEFEAHILHYLNSM
jgi:predicted nucleotidyltransferase